MSRPVTVVYDVADNARRQALAGVLRRDGGLWVQGSTWVIAPGAAPVRRVVADGARLIGRGDRLWAYEACPNCERRARWSPTGSSPYRAGTRLVVLEGGGGCPPG